jgi:hypothetical protein
LTIPTAGLNSGKNLFNADLYSDGIKSYKAAILLSPNRSVEIQKKIDKRSSGNIPKTIKELQSRYKEYRYINEKVKI